jgi:CDP-glucose 4,6-dehydratase
MALHWPKVRWHDVSLSEGGPYESGLLKLNCDKALQQLGWHAALGFQDTVRLTAEWYRTYYERPDAIAALTNAQIDAYTRLAREQGVAWAQ